MNVSTSSLASSILEISGGLILGATAYYNENHGAGYAVALAAITHSVWRIYTRPDQQPMMMYFSKHEGHGLPIFLGKPENKEDSELNDLYIEARINTAKNVKALFTKGNLKSESWNIKILECTQDHFSPKDKPQKTRFNETAAVKTFKSEDPPSEVSEETETKEEISTKPSVCTRRRVIVDDDYT